MNRKIMTAVLALTVAGTMAVTVLAQEGKEASAVQTAEQAGGNSGQVASKDEMATPQEVVSDDMVPVYADSLKEGTYAVDVLSSSSMFKVIDCQLTVESGEMTAAMTLNGEGYLKLYMGTGAEAAAADEADFITFELNEDGKQTYQVPVEALDMGIDCAAFSKKKEKWYDRTLVFSASSLPQEAFQDSVMTTAEKLGIKDGTYTVEVRLEGGSGKAAVESPTALTVKDGQATARITFGSPHYDYVLVDGEKYETVNTEGNSAFEIPVSGFDWKMPVTADTVAMSTPHEIDYTLYFDSATITEAEN